MTTQDTVGRYDYNTNLLTINDPQDIALPPIVVDEVKTDGMEPEQLAPSLLTYGWKIVQSEYDPENNVLELMLQSVKAPTLEWKHDDVIDFRKEDTDELLASLDPESDEAKELTAILDELQEDYGDNYGFWFIDVNYMPEYAYERAEDFIAYGEPGLDSWPYKHIDWDKAADDLADDYQEYEFTINGIKRDYYVQEM